MRTPRHSALLLAVFCSLTALALPAHAYLDPSTGSMILSAIVGLFATIGLAVKTYWYKLKRLFTGPSARPTEAPQAPPGAPPGSGRSGPEGEPREKGGNRSRR